VAEEQRSAGIIPYRSNNETNILLLHYPHGHWSFPKGHIEQGESEWEAGVRELKEETGLEPLQRDEEFEYAFDYYFKIEGKTIHKVVDYFSATVPEDQSVELSHEHQGYEWLPPDEVAEQITHDNATEMFRTWKNEVLQP